MGTIRVFCNGAGQIAANDADGCAPVWRFIELGAQARNTKEKAGVLRLRQRRAGESGTGDHPDGDYCPLQWNGRPRPVRTSPE